MLLRSELDLVYNKEKEIKGILTSFLSDRQGQLITEITVVSREESIFTRERWLEITNLLNSIESWLDEQRER